MCRPRLRQLLQIKRFSFLWVILSQGCKSANQAEIGPKFYKYYLLGFVDGGTLAPSRALELLQFPGRKELVKVVHDFNMSMPFQGVIGVGDPKTDPSLQILGLPHWLSRLCPQTAEGLNPDPRKPYLAGHGHLVSRSTIPVSHIITPILPIIKPLTKSP